MADISTNSNIFNNISEKPKNKKVEKPVDGQKKSIQARAMGVLLALKIAVGGSGVAHAGGLSPKELAEQEKVGITQVVEKEMLDLFATKKTVGRIVENRYENLSFAGKKELFKFYNTYKNHPDIFKLLSNGVTVIGNIDKSSNFIKEYDINKTYTNIPNNISDELEIMIDTDSSVKDYFSNNQKNSDYNYENILVLDSTIELIRSANHMKLQQELAGAKQELAGAKQELAGAKQELKNEQEIGVEIENLINYFNKLKGKL